MILFLVGLVARHVGSVLEAGLTIASILYGSLLGVFLLGLLTKRVQQNSAMIAMIAGLAADDLHSLRDQHRLHLVRRDRNRRNIFDRLRYVAILERAIP